MGRNRRPAARAQYRGAINKASASGSVSGNPGYLVIFPFGKKGRTLLPQYIPIRLEPRERKPDRINNTTRL